MDTRPFPWALPAAEALLIVIAILASAGLARRALRVDPAESLRNE
jgi:ABC-type antimicrobial peptide transport system permease subunit